MLLRLSLFILICFSSAISIAQNLVPNPSFESYKDIPTNFIRSAREYKNFVNNWTVPTEATPDYFHAKSRANAATGRKNFVGVQKPKEGEAYAGIFVLEHQTGSYREYLQVKLTEALKAGQTYTIQYYVSLSESSEYGIDRLGALLTSKQMDQKNMLPIVRNGIVESPDSLFFNSKTKWMAVRLSYTAKGGERFLIIGNFRQTREVHKKYMSYDRKKYYKQEGVYYFIDDVCVTANEEDGKSNCPCDSIDLLTLVQNDTNRVQQDSLFELGLEEKRVFVLPSLNFETDKSQIRPESFASLDSLAGWLNLNQEYFLRISGHTDVMGDVKHNDELSAARAQAVAEYLIGKGVDRERISFIGYGSEKPMADNETEAGRAKNRRVEFELIQSGN
jgi:OmpA-OmpF porin, OOP family